MSELLNRVIEYSGKNPYACYQCGMCSAVCPMIRYMNTPPHVIIRLLQIGTEHAVLSANTPWICVSCMRCVDRCPRDVDPGEVFEALRVIVLRQGIDKVKYEELYDVEEAPSMALIATSRKLTG
ncbi:MAG: 4Fe-4S dicluster domain-containing protein [Thermofilaceae archaeon]